MLAVDNEKPAPALAGNKAGVTLVQLNGVIMGNLAKLYKFPASLGEQEKAEVLKVASMDNGFTRLANELLEAAIYHDLSKRQYKIFFAIVRKTYGFQKKADRISGSQFSELTNMPRARCSVTVVELEAMKIIKRESGCYGLIEINKNVSEWLTLQPTEKPKKAVIKKTKVDTETVSSRTETVPPSRTETVSTVDTKTVSPGSTETVHTKERFKDNSKDISNCSKLRSEPAEKTKPVAWIYTNKKNVMYEIDQEQVNEWSELFPAVDVIQQLRGMFAWSKANPTRRKTSNGMARFIVSWLSKEQNNPSQPTRNSALGPNSKLVGDEVASLQQAVSKFGRLDDNEVL